MTHPKNTIKISSEDLSMVLEIMDSFKYEPDEDSCVGMSFFKARLHEDGFFIIKRKLEELLKSADN